MDLNVKLEIYEGPLDLLLHLIKKNEVDIYDIPIALITSQYLAYLELMESLNIELAGEFLLMAATLTQIKSKMLLPVLEEDQEEEEEDPRMAIVRPLLEHMKIRDAAEALERRAILDRDVFTRDVSLADLGLAPAEEALVEASLFELIDAFQRLVSKFEAVSGLDIYLETRTLQERINEIIIFLREKRQASFEELTAKDRTKAEFILSFLAVLELARTGCLRLYQHQTAKVIMLFFADQPHFVKTQPNEPDREEDRDYEEDQVE